MKNYDNLNKRITKEKEICRQTENVLRNLHSNQTALAKELSIQCKALKEVQSYFNVDFNETNGDDIDNYKETVDPREFLYEQIYLLKENNIKIKIKLSNVSSLPKTIELFQRLRKNKQILIFLKEIISESLFDMFKTSSFFSHSKESLKIPLFIRIVGCDRISRSFSLISILNGLPSMIKKSLKDTDLNTEGCNNSAKVKCDFLIDGKIIYSTTPRIPSLQCWNTEFDFVHDFNKPLEIQVVWLSPYKQLSNVINKIAPHYKSLDFVLGGFNYLFLDETSDRGFLNRSIDLYPGGRIFLETYVKSINKSKDTYSTLPQSSTISRTSQRFSESRPLSFSEFKPCVLLGTGCFGKIMLCQRLRDMKYYALKIIKKQRIVESDEFDQILTEKVVLETIKEHNHPLMVHLYSCIQDSGHIMFVLEFIQAGDLVTLIHNMGTFSDEQALFYIASVTLCIEFLHKSNIMYRDLKMENLLLDNQGYVKLVDFGLCKLNMHEKSLTSTFCGTIDYLAPEVLSKGKYTRMVDWWALGVLLYYMLIGEVPFSEETEFQSLDSILSKPISTPSDMSSITSSFIISLLNRNPKSRLGSKNGATEVKMHPYFKNVNFDKIYHRKNQAPFVPQLKHFLDLSFFDDQFTSQKPTVSFVDVDLLDNPDAKLFFDNFAVDCTL